MKIPLITQSRSRLEDELNLPSAKDNIFFRIIRDPTNPDRPMRERSTTEMLCGVLRNSEVVMRGFIAEALKKHGKSFPEEVESWRIETEVTAKVFGRTKYIDLLLEGLNSSSDRVLLLPVEVKVQAGFHESTYEESEAPEEQTKFRNQLENYRDWLDGEKTPWWGIVLSIPDKSHEILPEYGNWQCLTWTEFGLSLKEVINSRECSEQDRFLSRQLLGFIKENFWRESMSQIDFNDVALIKAYEQLANDLRQKTERLVDSLGNIFSDLNIEAEKCYDRKKIFDGVERLSVQRAVLNEKSNIILSLGFVDGAIGLVLGSSPAWAQKGEWTLFINSILANLGRNYNGAWQNPEDNNWRDVVYKVPLENLLAAPDQELYFRGICEFALKELKKKGAFIKLRELNDNQLIQA